jgi:hypothetical protein
LRTVVGEVAEVKRKRQRAPADESDDAYVFRFAKSVLEPAVQDMKGATSALLPEQAAGLMTEFQSQLSALYNGCREESAAAELDALTAADKSLSEFLELASKAKYDVRPRDDINSYEGSAGLLYNKFIFRSG